MVATRRNGHAAAPPRITANQVFETLMTAHKRYGPEWLFAGRMSAILGASGRNLDPPNRDLDRECGYPDPSGGTDVYRTLYNRGGIAARVVNIWPDECWAAYPELYETEDRRGTPFERAWDETAARVLPWHYLHRVDRISGIGHYGVLFLGIADAGGDRTSLETPVQGVDAVTGVRRKQARPKKLAYLRAFSEDNAVIESRLNDPGSPRHNLPQYYKLNFGDSADQSGASTGMTTGTQEVRVHWTRVIHVADNLEESETFGVPRMQAGLNYIYDIRKVCGSSAEMFFKGGFPGLQFKTDPSLTGEAEVDEDAVRAEVRAYQDGLQRYLSAVGGSWETITPVVADPSKHLTQLLTLLAATIGVPLRILLGTETGQSASTQTAGTWKERLGGRQKNYLEPKLARPFVDRLQDLGCLPRVQKYIMSWRDLKSLGDKDLADVGLKKVQAFMQYITGDVRQALPLHYLLTLLMGFSEDQARAIEKELKNNPPPAAPHAPPPPAPPAMAGAGINGKVRPQGGGRTGNPGRAAGRKPGNPAGRTPAGR